jgi:hypothetical protein
MILVIFSNFEGLQYADGVFELKFKLVDHFSSNRRKDFIALCTTTMLGEYEIGIIFKLYTINNCTFLTTKIISALNSLVNRSIASQSLKNLNLIFQGSFLVDNALKSVGNIYVEATETEVQTLIYNT